MMEETTDGLRKVRSIIIRETLGAVGPNTQLLAVEALLKRHHQAIAAVMRVARMRNNRVLAPEDAFGLVISIHEHATMASYWLALARSFRELPTDRPGRRPLSLAKSREKREAVLATIRSNFKLASRLMDDLALVGAPFSESTSSLFETLRLGQLCVKVNATICAKADLPPHQLRHMLAELDAIRANSDFDSRPPDDHQMLWQALSITYQALGDRAMVRTALNERRKLVSTDSDWLPMTLREALNYSESAEERCGVIGELNSLADEVDLGPVFSRERLGRLSVLRDSLWDVATGIDETNPLATSLLDECFACYEKWLFGIRSTSRQNVIRVATSWGGEGRISWYRTDQPRNISSFAIPQEVVTRLFSSTDVVRAETKPIRNAIKFLDEKLAPLLAEPIRRGGEQRIQAVGPIGLLPLLATSVDGKPIGGLSSVAHHHPNPILTISGAGSTDPYSLLVVDNCFGSDSGAVVRAARRAWQGTGDAQILAFNSEAASTALEVGELVESLRSAVSAVVFCHAVSQIAVANRAGLVLGPTARLAVEELAKLDLSNLQELALICCSSGRNNPFIGEVTLAHAAALAGAVEILFTLWPVRSSLGSRFVAEMIAARSAGQPMREFLASSFKDHPVRTSAFSIMRP
jgi:hypothetical protein